MMILVSFQIILCLLQFLYLCVKIPVLFLIFLRLLFLLVQSLDRRVTIPVLFRIILWLMFLFVRYFDLHMKILVLFRILLHIYVSCSSNDYLSCLFLSISIDLFLIMMVGNLRTARLSLTVHHNSV